MAPHSQEQWLVAKMRNLLISYPSNAAQENKMVNVYQRKLTLTHYQIKFFKLKALTFTCLPSEE